VKAVRACEGEGDMKCRAAVMGILLTLCGCATTQTIIVPADPNRFKDQQSRAVAANLADAKCTAQAEKAAASVQEPPVPQHTDDAYTRGAHLQASMRADSTRNSLRNSTYAACLAEEGWMLSAVPC
jgi:hypothetical protein